MARLFIMQSQPPHANQAKTHRANGMSRCEGTVMRCILQLQMMLPVLHSIWLYSLEGLGKENTVELVLNVLQ